MSTSFEATDWGRYAACYDTLLRLTPYHDMLAEVVKASQSLRLGPILDASCGTGNLEYMFTRTHSGSSTPIMGVDASYEMLSAARQKCNMYSAFRFMHLDLNDPTPFEDGSFEQIISLNTLYALTDPEAVLREFHRVLRPGGHILLVTPKRGYENGMVLKVHSGSTRPDAYWTDGHASEAREEMLIREAIADEEMVQDLLLVARYNRAIAHTHAFHFFEPAELELLFNQAGFTVLRSSPIYAAQDNFIVARKGA